MNKQKITDIIANSTLWEVGKDGHNALSELVESLIKYREQEIKKKDEIIEICNERIKDLEKFIELNNS